MSKNKLKLSSEAVYPKRTFLGYSPCEIYSSDVPIQNRKGEEALYLIKYLGNMKNLQLSNFIERLVYIP